MWRETLQFVGVLAQLGPFKDWVLGVVRCCAWELPSSPGTATLDVQNDTPFQCYSAKKYVNVHTIAER